MAWDSLESNTYIFMVRIWIDVDVKYDSDSELVWRGEIENVMDEDASRIAFQSLKEIPDIIRPVLESRGVRFGQSERLQQRLRRMIATLFSNGA